MLLIFTPDPGWQKVVRIAQIFTCLVSSQALLCPIPDKWPSPVQLKVLRNVQDSQADGVEGDCSAKLAQIAQIIVKLFFFMSSLFLMEQAVFHISCVTSNIMDVLSLWKKPLFPYMTHALFSGTLRFRTTYKVMLSLEIHFQRFPSYSKVKS